MVVGAHSDQGPIQFTIVEIDEEVVTADFNHQMAGRTLRFEVEVVDIRAASEEELAWACPWTRWRRSLNYSEELSSSPIIQPR